MNWYKISQINPQVVARQLGIIYNGPQSVYGKIVGHMFTDPKTKSSFMVRIGQNISQKLREVRKRFGF